MALTVLIQVIILSIMILLGYILGKVGYIRKDHSDFMSKLVLEVFFPGSVLASVNNEFEGGIGTTLIIMTVYFFILILFYGIGYGAATIMKLTPDERQVFANGVGYPNNGFMGIPLCTAVFGAQGTLWAALTIPGTSLYIFLVLTLTMQRKKEGGGIDWKIIATPLNISVVIMLILVVLGIKLPSPIYTVANSLGSCVTPVAMLLIGYLLSASPLLDALRRPAVYAITFVRNLLCPIIGAVLLSFTSWNREMCLCLVTVMACSMAASVSIFASRYNRAPAFASQCMLQSTLLVPLTMPVVTFIAERILF